MNNVFWVFKSERGYHTDCMASSREELIDEANKRYGGGGDRYSSNPFVKPVCVKLTELTTGASEDGKLTIITDMPRIDDNLTSDGKRP